MSSIHRLHEVSMGTPAQVLDLTKALPPTPRILDRALSATLRSLSDQGDLGSRIRANRPGGDWEDRQYAAAWLSCRFDPPPALERIIVTNGTQSALSLILRHVAGPGDLIVAEQLTYVVFSRIVGRLGMRIEGIPLDEHGLAPEAFEAVCRERKPKALYCNPTVQNPTASVMPEARRMQIADIARRYGVWIVEDDVLGPLHGASPRPISAIAPDVTWYCMSLSKCFALGLRLAYVLSPTVAAAADLLKPVQNLSSWFPAPLSLMVVADWIRSGLGRMIATSIRDEMIRRQALAAPLLRNTDYKTASGALHVWLTLPQRFDPIAFEGAALRSGVAIRPSSLFCVGDSPAPNAIRISLSSPVDTADLESGLRRIAALLEQNSVAP
jgi:DNA-binding transcriptional MocR family regulator